MKITAALCWFDEPLDFLDRCVRSLAGLADDLVALDGAWKWFPGGAQSNWREAEMIRLAAADIDLPCAVITPQTIYESQVAKRNHLMELAGGLGDWILVIDGDEYVAHADPDTVRAQLADTEHVVAAVEITNLHRGGEIPGYHPDGGLRRRVYRSGTSVQRVHTGYFHDGRPLYRSEPVVDLSAHLRLEHDNCNRGDRRNQRSIEYRVAREREGVEVWV